MLTADTIRYTVAGNELELFSRPVHPDSEEFDPDRMECLTGIFPIEWRKNNELFLEWARQTFRQEDFTSGDVADELWAKFKAREAGKHSDSSDSGDHTGPQRSEVFSGNESIVSVDDPLTRSMELPERERRSSSTHATRPSGLSSVQAAGKATAKEAGRKAAEAGLTTVAEGSGGAEDDGDPQRESEAAVKRAAEEERGDEADDEDSPESKSSRKGGRKTDT